MTGTGVPRSRWPTVVLLLPILVASGGTLLYRHLSRSDQTVLVRPQEESVPVVVETVARHDIPITLRGLGTAQASTTIAIQPQVDGELVEVLFTEGQRVRKGDLLARIDPSLYRAALVQAMAKRAETAAQLVVAEKDLARAKNLIAGNVETQQDLDRQQGKVDQLRAQVDADDADIDTARTRLARTDIVAPSDGRLGIRLIDAGNILRTADKPTIVMLANVQPATVVFTLPARHLEEMRTAMARGPLEVAALDRDNRVTLDTGTLLLIDNVIDQATATIRLKATFANTDERLWPGEFVNVRVLLGIRRDVLTVPAPAVQRGPRGLLAWVVTTAGTAEMRPVTIGDTVGSMTTIAAGLSEGERVVVEGRLKLRPGVAVRPLSAGTVAAGAGRERL